MLELCLQPLPCLMVGICRIGVKVSGLRVEGGNEVCEKSASDFMKIEELQSWGCLI